MAFRAYTPSKLGNFPYPYQPGGLYTLGKRSKKLWFLTVFANDCAKDGGGTFYALANQGRALDFKWYVEFNHTLPHPGGMRGFVYTFLLHSERAQNEVYGY